MNIMIFNWWMRRYKLYFSKIILLKNTGETLVFFYSTECTS